MINTVILEEFVVHAWTFADDCLYRIASLPDPGLPSNDSVALDLSSAPSGSREREGRIFRPTP